MTAIAYVVLVSKFLTLDAVFLKESVYASINYNFNYILPFLQLTWIFKVQFNLNLILEKGHCRDSGLKVYEK